MRHRTLWTNFLNVDIYIYIYIYIYHQVMQTELNSLSLANSLYHQFLWVGPLGCIQGPQRADVSLWSSANATVPMYRSLWENVLTSQAVFRKSLLSYLDALWDGWLKAIQWLFCLALIPGFLFKVFQKICMPFPY